MLHDETDGDVHASMDTHAGGSPRGNSWRNRLGLGQLSGKLELVGVTSRGRQIRENG
jgi:hypothetical protein